MDGANAPNVPASMIISGSSVAVVGGILLVTTSFAFVMMVAFGTAMAIFGALKMRQSAKNGPTASEQE